MTSTAFHFSPATTRFPAFAMSATGEAPSLTEARRGATGTAFSLLYLDLDSIKLIQDAHGQDVGEWLLRAVTMRLERSVRTQDVVNYLGGDKFSCQIGGGLNHDQLSHLACKLFDVVSEPFKIGPLDVMVRPSIGIAMSPADGDTTEALLKGAGAAMLRAKRIQSGYAFFHEADGITIG